MCFDSASNFLSPTVSLTLCFLLSWNKCPDDPPPFSSPGPWAPDPWRSGSGPRDPDRLREEPAVAGGSGSGRVNQCFPIGADMHFTRRDSPQPAN